MIALGRRSRSESDFDVWLDEVTERADPFMSWLGIVFALLVGYELAVELSPRATLVVAAASWSIWVVFLIEFLAKLWLAPRRGRFLRRHWFQALMLVVPTLRVLRFLRLLRLGRALPAARVVSSSYRTAGTARKLLRSRLGYVAAISVIVVIALAELAYLLERDGAETFRSFGDALLWSAAVVLALQGDPIPATTLARLAMLAGFAFGLVIVATLAGTVGAFLVDERRERAAVEDQDSRDATTR